MSTSDHPITIEVERYLASVTAAIAMGEHDYPPIAEDLLKRLGCPYWSSETWEREYPMLPSEDRVFARAALTRLVTLINTVNHDRIRVAEACAIITGLHDAGRWQDCLDDVDSAYGLATSICFILDVQFDPDAEDTDYASTAVLAILNDWLDHDYLWSALPDVAEVAERLFGSAWCSVASSGIDFDIGGLCRMIEQDRPPFLPGLCRGQALDVAGTLPDLAR